MPLLALAWGGRGRRPRRAGRGRTKVGRGLLVLAWGGARPPALPSADARPHDGEVGQGRRWSWRGAGRRRPSRRPMRRAGTMVGRGKAAAGPPAVASRPHSFSGRCVGRARRLGGARPPLVLPLSHPGHFHSIPNSVSYVLTSVLSIGHLVLIIQISICSNTFLSSVLHCKSCTLLSSEHCNRCFPLSQCRCMPKQHPHLIFPTVFRL